MSTCLLIETATFNGSVALSRNGVVVEQLWLGEGQKHITALAPTVQQLLESQNATVRDLSCVAVSIGPGSYTGLRIAVSYAKGLSMALGIPIVGIPTLSILAEGIWKKHTADYAVPLLDARRMEVYTTVVDAEGNAFWPIQPMVIDATSFDQLSNQQVVFAGNGVEKVAKTINQSNFLFDSDIKLEAGDMAALVEQRVQQGSFDDAMELVPHYLKEFAVGAPSQKIKSILGA